MQKPLPQDPKGWHPYATLILFRWEECIPDGYPKSIHEIADVFYEEAKEVGRPYYRFMNERDPIRSSLGSAVWFLERKMMLGVSEDKRPMRMPSGDLCCRAGAIRYRRTKVFQLTGIHPEWTWRDKRVEQKVRRQDVVSQLKRRPKTTCHNLLGGF